MRILQTVNTIADKFAFGLFILLMSFSALAAELTVTVTGVAQERGKLLLALYNSEEAFFETRLSAQQAVAIMGDMSFTFTDLPAGEYAVMVIHDVNGNGKLDTNLFGLPTEPWGASLQGKTVFGAPKWVDTKFSLSDEGLALNLPLR